MFSKFKCVFLVGGGAVTKGGAGGGAELPVLRRSLSRTKSLSGQKPGGGGLEAGQGSRQTSRAGSHNGTG